MATGNGNYYCEPNKAKIDEKAFSMRNGSSNSGPGAVIATNKMQERLFLLRTSEEMYNEIQTLRANVEKLQENNVHLRHELKQCRQLDQTKTHKDQISRLFQENCSLKEDNSKLSIENKQLKKQAHTWQQKYDKLIECFISGSIVQSPPSVESSSASSRGLSQLSWNSECLKSKVGSPNEKQPESRRLSFPEGVVGTLPADGEAATHRHVRRALSEKFDEEGVDTLNVVNGLPDQLDPQPRRVFTAENTDWETVVKSCMDNAEIIRGQMHSANASLAKFICQKQRLNTSSQSAKEDLEKLKEWSGEGSVVTGKFPTVKKPGGSEKAAVSEQELPEDQTCPMCGKIYGTDTCWGDYEAHVFEHFENEEYEFVNK